MFRCQNRRRNRARPTRAGWVRLTRSTAREEAYGGEHGGPVKSVDRTDVEEEERGEEKREWR